MAIVAGLWMATALVVFELRSARFQQSTVAFKLHLGYMQTGNFRDPYQVGRKRSPPSSKWELGQTAQWPLSTLSLECTSTKAFQLETAEQMDSIPVRNYQYLGFKNCLWLRCQTGQVETGTVPYWTDNWGKPPSISQAQRQTVIQVDQ